MTEHSKHIDESQLLQFLLGELTDTETQQVSEWLLASAENQQMLDKLEAIWAETGKLTPTPVAVDTPFAWGKLSDKIDEFELNNNEKGKIITLGRKKVYRFISGIAAILVISFGIFTLINLNNDIPNLALTSNKDVVYSLLPDGSQIALNVNSKITYPKKFNRKTREVNLEGDAFFSVEHNPKQPFIVNTKNAKIKVLGTKFRINSNEENEVSVAVTSGKVQLFTVDSILGDTLSVILKSGEQGRYEEGNSKPQIIDAPIDPESLFWMRKTLEFRSNKLSEVLLILEKNYNVQIRVENQELYNCIYTASFTENNIEEILNMLATSFDLELIKQNNIYILRGNGCQDDFN